jgi:prepilin-type N-terminal cleavage/methylation domain-containing protein
MPNNKKGFTLIELLVVMGILGILMAVTILVINPAEYLKRSRDTQRINDLGAINSALGIYGANGGATTSYAYCILAAGAGTTVTTTAGLTCNGGAVTSVPAVTDVRTVANAGWVKGVDFTSSTYFPGGSPFASLPVDPSTVAASQYYYIFSSSATAFELDANVLESSYYSTAGTATNDGGNSTTKYEVGTSLTLIN